MSHFNKKYHFVEDTCYVERIFMGLMEDVEMLYNEFLKSDLSFKSFAELWRKLKFASIFGERYAVWELLEFTEGVQHFSKGYILSNDIKAVIFGIYFAYAVYNKQPLKKRITKLRLTKDEFNELTQRFHQLMDLKYDDAARIILHMFRTSAFHYVATPLAAGLELGFKKYAKNEGFQEQPDEETPTPVDSNLVEHFNNISKLYAEKKKAAFENSEVFNFETNFSEELRQRLKNFGRPTTQKEPVEIQEEPANTSHGNLRRRLKKMAFEHGAIEPALQLKPTPRVKERTGRSRTIKLEVKAETEMPVEEETHDEEVEEYQSFDFNIFD